MRKDSKVMFINNSRPLPIMYNEEIIISKADALILLKSHYAQTIEYIKRREEGDTSAVPQMWNLHIIMSTTPVVRNYFTPAIIEESSKLLNEFDSLLEKLQKAAFLESQYVKDYYFPWFEHLDFYGNLEKTLTPEEIEQYQLPFSGYRLMLPCLATFQQHEIDKDAFDRLCSSSDTLELYQKRKTLEERMLEHAKTFESC
jgi:hypothetical protein